MPKIVKISEDRLEAIKAKLLATPVPERKKKDLNRQEAIHAMKKELLELQKRGFTWAEIATLLKSEGLEVSMPTLKTYINAAKPTKPKTAAPAPVQAPAQNQEHEPAQA